MDDYLGIGTVGGGNSRPLIAVGPGFYGFNWWFNTGWLLWPGLPSDTFQANRHWNSKTLTVIPSLGIVVAWVDGTRAAPEEFGPRFAEALSPFVRSILQSAPVTPCGP